MCKSEPALARISRRGIYELMVNILQEGAMDYREISEKLQEIVSLPHGPKRRALVQRLSETLAPVRIAESIDRAFRSDPE